MNYKIKQICNKISRYLLINNKTNKNNSLNLGYISAEETIKRANEKQMSICDFVENEWGQIGSTQKVINNMENYSVFKDAKYICEIGAGTGRYMEKVLNICKPFRYESYETASDWAVFLKNTYPITSCMASGKNLNQTKDNSIDLLHAHGVFVYLPFLISIQYFLEIARVVKQDGYVVFDICSEDCMDNEIIKKWINSEHIYPCFLSTNYVDDFFVSNNFFKIGSFLNKYGEGVSKYMIYKKI